MQANAQAIEKAVLVQLNLDHRLNPNHRMDELVRLSESAGFDVKASVIQNREYPDPRWLIGKGKVDELRAVVETEEADTVVFGSELTTAQVRNLERVLDVKIIDRTQLILDIFAQRAHTREGQIQVELAQLNYLLPRLTGHGFHLSRLGGGIGTRGPGETKLETDRRHIRRRIADLNVQLQEVVRHRELYRERRRRQGIFQVALAGYTNAGKSTLLGALTSSHIFAEDRLFATLDPTSRSLILPSGNEVILTDTVGFIQDLPHDLVAAFRATLEEVLEADLILHVVDATAEARDQQVRTVNKVLEELGASAKDVLHLYNKSDQLQDELPPAGKDALWISAFNKDDLEKVKLEIQRRLLQYSANFSIPVTEGYVIAKIHELGEVVEKSVDETHMRIKARIHPADYERMKKWLEPYKEQK